MSKIDVIVKKTFKLPDPAMERAAEERRLGRDPVPVIHPLVPAHTQKKRQPDGGK